MTIQRKAPYIVIIFLALVAVSCKGPSRNADDRPLARVGDDILYMSDLQGLVAKGSNPSDSADISKEYIRKWIKDRLVIRQAESNLSPAEKDFEKELEEYKNSLLVYRYESRLISQKLDTVITEKEISDYYIQNPENFQLKDNIVKVIYVKIDKKSPLLAKIRKHVRAGREEDIEQLERLCATAAENYFLDDQSWLLFNDLLKEIPIKTYDQEDYLKNHRFIEITDERRVFLVNVKEFKIKESLSPLSFEQSNIREILINKRKLKLIEEMERTLFEKASKSGGFEIY